MGPVSLYFVQDVSVFRKYTAWMDTFTSYGLDMIIGRVRAKTYMTAGGYWKGVKAMLRHKSQLLWFRYFYIMLSRYMYINVLVKHER